MRRMRDFSIGHYVAATVPVLGLIYGIFHGMRPADPVAGGKDVTAVLTPAQFRLEGAKVSRKIASAAGEKDSVRHGAREMTPAEAEDVVDDREDVAREAAEEAAAAARPSHPGHPEVADIPRAPASDANPSQALEAASNDAAAVGADCAPLEYRGDGPQLTRVTKGEWTAVMDQFHSAKRDLLGWLEKHHLEMSESAAQALGHQISTLKIQRPPASDEPDLSWRGIGVYSQTTEGEPIVKLGGGFVKLASRHPARARFEMARLVAQAWAPCELQRVNALDATWAPLLKCLGITDAQECGQGSYSEIGWAVSTTLAASIRPPGCRIPAFKLPEMARCVLNVPIGRISAQNNAEPASMAARMISSFSSFSSSSADGGHK